MVRSLLHEAAMLRVLAILMMAATLSAGCALQSDDQDAPGQGAHDGAAGEADSECTGLVQADCEAASACRAIFTSDCIDQRCVDTPGYAACWPTDGAGPIQGGTCENLDEPDCSQHDDCAAVHERLEYPTEGGGFGNAIGDFGYCIGEE